MVKKLIAIVTCMLVCMTMVVGALTPMSASALSTSDYSAKFAGNGAVYAQGIDVSQWQAGNVNFAAIKAAGYDFVILRAGYSGAKDPYFETFYSQAKAAGLDVGAYYYCYATYAGRGSTDAYEFISWLSGKTFEYPCYLDFEDEKYQGGLAYSVKAATCIAFLDVMEANGYLTGLYSMASWLNQSWVSDYGIRANYEGWIAHIYNDTYTWGHSYATTYGMYQYTWEKYVTNSGGPYDANVAYKDYPTIVKTYGFNNYESAIEEIDYTTYYYPACPSTSETMYATMNSMGIVGNYTNLKAMALANGYTEDTYSGTAEQNTALLNLWKQGLLKNPNATYAESYPYASSSATTLAGALSAYGYATDSNTISKIAIKNGTGNETTLLNLMKEGKLLVPDSNVTLVELESDDTLSKIKKNTNFTVSSSSAASGDALLYTGSGGNVKFSFTGTKFDLITTVGPRLKSLHISIDGGDEIRVETGATSATYMKKVFSSNTLSSGTHTVRIRCEGQTHLDAVQIYNGNLVACTDSLEDKVNVEPSTNANSVKLTGNWVEISEKALDNGAGIKTVDSGNVHFTFYGSQFVINSVKADDQGTLYVSIDGGEETAIDLLQATADSTYRAQIYDSGILKAGTHNVVLRAEGGAYIDSIDVYGKLNEAYICNECENRLADVSFVCEHTQMSVSDMMATYQDVTADFSIVDSSSLTGGDSGVASGSTYFYSTSSGTARKNGFAIYNPVKGDFYGNESEWTVDTWVYISDISSYYMIMQFIPQSGLSMYSVSDSSKFNNYTENWAYRMRFTNQDKGDGIIALKQGWNHLQIPLSDFLFGSTGNAHNVAAYQHLNDMKGVLDAVTFHDNTASNYGTYNFGVASINLVRTHTCDYIENTVEIEKNLDKMVVSNAWVKRYNNHLSARNAIHTSTGGKLQFTFDGTKFSLVSYKSPSQGKVYISIDGGKEFLAADLYAEVADTYFKETVYTSDKLANTSHTVTIRVDGKAYLDALKITGQLLNCTTPIHDDVTIEVENILDAEYTGTWTQKYAWKHSGHNAMYTSNGGTVSFDFEGDELSILSYKASSQGKMYISVDGGAEVEINLYDESSDTLYATEVYSLTDLSYDIHTVEIRTEGKAYVDAIVINRESAETVTVEAELGELTLEGDWEQKYAWKHSGHNAMYTTNNGTASFSYTGYDFRILSYKASSQGKMYISVDGGEAYEISLYDNSTDTKYKEIVFEAAGLDYGTHTVEITTAGKVYFDAVKIDGTMN